MFPLTDLCLILAFFSRMTATDTNGPITSSVRLLVLGDFMPAALVRDAMNVEISCHGLRKRYLKYPGHDDINFETSYQT